MFEFLVIVFLLLIFLSWVSGTRWWRRKLIAQWLAEKALLRRERKAEREAELDRQATERYHRWRKGTAERKAKQSRR